MKTSLFFTAISTVAALGAAFESWNTLVVDEAPQYVRPYVLPKNYGQAVAIGQQIYRFSVTGNSSGGAFTLLQTNAPASTSLGVLPHIHKEHYENFYCTRGRFQLWAKLYDSDEEEQTRVLTQGDYGAVPHNTIHTYQVLDPDTQMTGVIQPGGFEKLFISIADSTYESLTAASFIPAESVTADAGAGADASTISALEAFDVYAQLTFSPRTDTVNGTAGSGNWHNGSNELGPDAYTPNFIAKNYAQKYLNIENGYKVIAPLVTDAQSNGNFTMGTITMSAKLSNETETTITPVQPLAFQLEEGELVVIIENETATLIEGDVLFVPANTTFSYFAAVPVTKFLYVSGGSDGFDYDLLVNSTEWEYATYPSYAGKQQQRPREREINNMVPENSWREAGQNMDKRTARKVHADAFKRTLKQIRTEYLRAHAVKQGAEETEPQLLDSDQIHVYVRKRPLLPHELEKHEFDVISCVGQSEIVIHECKMYPDMRHKYVVSHHQRFSTCYPEHVDTEQVYLDAVKHLLLHTMEGGKAVCMMYGQTGSGKTYTMGGLFQYIAEDLFTEAVGNVDFAVSVSAIEIVGSKCFDLIHDRNKVVVCEDRDGNINLMNSSEVMADSTNALLDVLQNVKELRTTEGTAVNSQSSRSHLVCYINLRHRTDTINEEQLGELYGQIVLLDLAGSERNEDTFYHDAARRKEGIEINKSHLALKECIRAIGREDSTGYVPYRASTLTRILKGCLWSKDSRASVIATISPLSIDTEHTLHTLLCAGQMLEDAPHISTDRRDVKEDGEEEPILPIRDWDNHRVKTWVSNVRKGHFEKYVTNINGSVDGRMLVRFSLARFSQICNGNSSDGALLLKVFRDEMASLDQALKARRERNAARRK